MSFDQRVRVQDIVIWSEHQGMTPDEIVSHIPAITLAYYFDHLQEIQDDLNDLKVHMNCGPTGKTLK